MASPDALNTELSVQGESLQSLYNDYISNKFLVNRRYQRKLVWTVDEKARLIDSVRRRLPIPLILLAQSTQGDAGSRVEVIDGLQRLNAIFSFIENEFPLDGEYFDLETLADTKLLKDEGRIAQGFPVMSRAQCRDFTNYQLAISTYKSANESSVDEVFRRINSSGRYLSLQEIRQAGALSEISILVRRVSSTIRGDASLTDHVTLSDMPKISITNKDLKYGILDTTVFWVRQGVLSRENVRASRDEELVLDLLLDLILDPLASSGSEYRNAAYGTTTEGVEPRQSSTSATLVRTRLLTIGPEEIERRLMTTLDLLETALDQVGSTYSTWTITQQNPRGVPRQFHALFVAVQQLLAEGLVPKSVDAFATAIKGFWDKGGLSVPGGGNWGAELKVDLINAIKGRLKPHFKPTEDPHAIAIQEQALRFEALLRMSLTELAMFELKQGFCRLSDPSKFDDAAFAKVLRTASAMANVNSTSPGSIIIGVADDAKDAAAIKKFLTIDAAQLDKFYITGTQHELTALGRSIDDHFRWLITAIKGSKLDVSFAEKLASTLKPFRYQDRLLWILEPKAQSQPVTYDGKFYDRIGPNTVEVTSPQATIDLVRRFS